jgi:manganese-dependent inorganic pyrophosphatase
MTKPIYVIGHRNPDTDSICSAIGYAHLKRSLGINALAARAGKLNNETKYILETLKVATPLLINDLYPRVKDITKAVQVTIHPDQTLKELGNLMKENNAKSIPVIDDKQLLCGIVSVGDLARRYFEELGMPDLSESNVEYAAVVKVLDGTLLQGSTLGRKVKGRVKIAAAKLETMIRNIAAGDIVLVGDRLKIQLACIKTGVACLVVTGNCAVHPDVCQAAFAANVIIISAPYDTYSCGRLINQSVPVRMVMQQEVITFKPSQLVMDIKNTIAMTRFRNYPVVENGHFVGIVDRDSFIIPEREKIILVDHNEAGQAVEGIHEADIIEVVDHHRLGGLETSSPITMLFEPVGCTATIVANLYWQNNITFPKDMAGLLLSAIISDTVLFKSPTCTEKDRSTAKKLAEIADLDIKKHGMALLKAGSDIDNMSAADILRNDFKEFQMGDYRVAITQMSVLDGESILAMKGELQAEMRRLRHKEGYDMVLLMDTDILNECTYLFFEGQPISLIADAFGSIGTEGVLYLPHVLSRKKQVVPPLTDAARQEKA